MPPSDDLLQVQDDLIQRLVATLAGRIEEVSIDTSRRKRPGSAVAFDLLLQGIHHANRLDRASNLLGDRAVRGRNRPRPGLCARLGLARADAAAPMGLATRRGRTLLRRATAAARALSLDPSESWCHLVAGQVAMYAGELDAAEVHHKKALVAEPL